MSGRLWRILLRICRTSSLWTAGNREEILLFISLRVGGARVPREKTSRWDVFSALPALLDAWGMSRPAGRDKGSCPLTPPAFLEKSGQKTFPFPSFFLVAFGFHKVPVFPIVFLFPHSPFPQGVEGWKSRQNFPLFPPKLSGGWSGNFFKAHGGFRGVFHILHSPY